MMINQRLISEVTESKKYIAGNVFFQWCSLAANMVMMTFITKLLADLYVNTADRRQILMTMAAAVLAVSVRFVCTWMSACMGYISSRSWI
ncbi:MAG: hypothetical protein ACI4DV_03815 [Lachnospiraceae bacterium]